MNVSSDERRRKWKNRVHKGRLEESAKETRIQLKTASSATRTITMTETAQPGPCTQSLITLPASQSVRQGGTVHGEVGKMDASDNLQATADAERSAIRNAMNVSVGKSSD